MVQHPILLAVGRLKEAAVSRAEGESWKHKLLRLPTFLGEVSSAPPDRDDIAAGFTLTRYFLLRHVFEPRGLRFPDARASFIAAVVRNDAATSTLVE